MVKQSSIIKHSDKYASGFTLIELAIVIVIIGFIVAGVLTGQELVEQTKMKNTIREINTIQTAVTTFRLKYQGIPGDMPDRFGYFNFPCVCTSGCAGKICSGDNNGKIANVTGHNNPRSEESYNAWMILIGLGLWPNIPNITPYVSGPFGGNFIPGDNVPASSYNENAGYYIIGTSNSDAATLEPTITSGVGILIAGKNGTGTQYGPLLNGIIKPINAGIIDTKMDDGQRTKGKVISVQNPWGPSNCTSYTSTYNVDEDGCRMYINLQ